MKYTILYPADFFDIKKVDPDYEDEYREAIKFPDFQVLFYNYDDFITGGQLKVTPEYEEDSLCVYRGWMLQPDRYEELYISLKERGLTLINTPLEYENCHEFPGSYPLIESYTPRIKCYKAGERINWTEVRTEFKRFMMKDYVKSVKDTDFPVFFDGTCSDEEMDHYVTRFIEMRGRLFVKGIVLKEYVSLKKNAGVTNEYRAFFLDGRCLSLSKNSNQQDGNKVPEQLIHNLPALNSGFYTVDFAELENGEWIMIETGDGQVSGLSPGQHVLKFYENLLNLLQERLS